MNESIRRVENLTKIFRPFSGAIIKVIDQTFDRKCRFQTPLDGVSVITANKSNFLAVIQKFFFCVNHGKIMPITKQRNVQNI